jgi:hypothetical protein
MIFLNLVWQHAEDQMAAHIDLLDSGLEESSGTMY